LATADVDDTVLPAPATFSEEVQLASAPAPDEAVPCASQETHFPAEALAPQPSVQSGRSRPSSSRLSPHSPPPRTPLKSQSPGQRRGRSPFSDGESDMDITSEIDPAIEVAQLWGKWPPSCGSGNRGLLGGARSSTPTTRPPSQGDGLASGLASGPSSRPSTRTSSRGLSGRNMSSRPSSSPLIGGKRSDHRPPLGRQPALDRPASSPMLHRKQPQSAGLHAVGGAARRLLHSASHVSTPTA